MKMNAEAVIAELEDLKDLEKARHSERFFKTGPESMLKEINFLGYECLISEK